MSTKLKGLSARDQALRQYLECKAHRKRVVFMCGSKAEARDCRTRAARLADMAHMPPLVSVYDFLHPDQILYARSRFLDAVLVDPIMIEQEQVSREVLDELLALMQAGRERAT